MKKLVIYLNKYNISYFVLIKSHIPHFSPRKQDTSYVLLKKENDHSNPIIKE